jgi:hypothetical protein
MEMENVKHWRRCKSSVKQLEEQIGNRNSDKKMRDERIRNEKRTLAQMFASMTP